MSVVKRESVMLSWHEVERVVIESVRATGVAIGEGAEMKTHAAGVEVAWTRVEDVSIPRLEEAARAIPACVEGSVEVVQRAIDVEDRGRLDKVRRWLLGD